MSLTREEIMSCYVFAWMNLSGEKIDKTSPLKHYEEFSKLLDNLE